jgi:hypothetical protein
VYVRDRINGVPAAYPPLFLSRPSIDLGIGVDLRALLRSSQKPAKIADFLHAQSRRRRDEVIAPPMLARAIDVLPTAATAANASRKKFFNSPLETTFESVTRDSKRANRENRFGRHALRRRPLGIVGAPAETSPTRSNGRRRHRWRRFGRPHTLARTRRAPQNDTDHAVSRAATRSRSDHVGHR